jgi:hypothetical protein
MNVQDFFESINWRRWGNQGQGYDYYSKVIEGTPCRCNDRLVIGAKHHTIDIHGSKWESVTLEIVGEAPDGQWFHVDAYSIKKDELTQELVADIQRRLVAAWEALQ